MEHQPTTAPLDWNFLKRTFWSTLAVTVLLAPVIAAIQDIGVGARYLGSATWAILFFTMSALIFRHLLILKNKPLGIVFIFLKMLTLAVMIPVLYYWPPQGEFLRGHQIAMIGGISTPLLVVFFQGMGLALRMGLDQARSNAGAAENGPIELNTTADTKSIKSRTQVGSLTQ